MSETSRGISIAPRGVLPTLMMTTVGILLLALLVFTSRADAAYSQVDVFAGSPTPLSEEELQADEEIQLGGVSGIAVNRTGAGGVPAGTVYAVTRFREAEEGNRGPGTKVAIYEPTEGGGLEFVERWAVLASEGSYEVCGPNKVLPNGSAASAHLPCPARLSGSAQSLGIAVDQSDGHVFVFGGFEGATNEVVVYPADGGNGEPGGVLTRFAERVDGQTVAESPGKIHYPSNSTANRLAVDSTTGEVYVYDELSSGVFYRRLMVFGPHEGNRSEYEYLGEVLPHKLGDGEHYSRSPVLDDSGHIYVAGTQESGDHIEEFSAQSPAAYPASEPAPICSYEYAKRGVTAMTVNPETGEPFFFSEKKISKHKVVQRLGPCDLETGEFGLPEEGAPETIAMAPERGDIVALAFDPDRLAGGALYAGVPEPNGTGEGGQSALGYIFVNPAELAPEIEAESTDHVTATSAMVHAEVDPNGFATSYVFQYLTEAEYLGEGETFAGAAEAPFGGGTLSASGGKQDVAAAIGPLLPDTAYRVRLVASSLCKGPAERRCEVTGEGIPIRTFPIATAILPDGRAWEMVSPANKGGGQVMPANPVVSSCGETACKPGGGYQHFPMQSTPDGNGVGYEGTNFGLGGAVRENEYLAFRDPSSGWQTTGSTPSALFSGGGGGYKSLASDLGASVFEQNQGAAALAAGAPAGYAELYAQSTASPFALAPLVTTAAPLTRTAAEFKLRFAGASADGRRVFFEANDALTSAVPGIAPAAPQVGVNEFDLYEWHEGSLALVSAMPDNATAMPGEFVGIGSSHGVSTDGSHAFFEAGGRLYVRIDGRETRRIEHKGKFLGASADGSEALLSDGCLYGLSSESCIDLTEGHGGFEGILGQSQDLSHVFFVDTEVLDAGAEATANNLYAWTGGAPHFVAKLAAGDNFRGSGELARDWVPVAAERTAEASPDGRYLAFLSQELLTGYRNIGPCESDHSGGYTEAPCPEVFVYDSVTGRLACASCNPTGSAPLGWSVLPRIQNASFAPQPRYVTDSGRVFFDSRDSLSQLDTNEGAEDVYEWEPKGVGGPTMSCESEFAEGGCVALVSAGRESSDSNFVAASESGADVFFTTRDRLVGADTDQLFDLYDARQPHVAGEVVGFGEEPPPRSCQGEACQGASPAPAPSPAASTGFTGSGNYQPPAGCPKGKVKRGGKCVARHRKNHKHHKHRKNHKSHNKHKVKDKRFNYSRKGGPR